MTPVTNNETTTLIRYLDAQRDSVVAILAGLDDAALNSPVVASGWTPLGLIAHLCGAEHLWLHHLLGGSPGNPPPWPTDGPYSPFTVDLATSEVIDFYRRQSAISNEFIAASDLDAPLRIAAPPELAEYGPDVRSTVLHMIEETARHAGHLDIARELIDGSTGLGPR